MRILAAVLADRLAIAASTHRPPSGRVRRARSNSARYREMKFALTTGWQLSPEREPEISRSPLQA